MGKSVSSPTNVRNSVSLALNKAAAFPFPTIIENINTNVGGGGRDYTKLHLGAHHANFSENMKLRLEILKEVLIKSRNESPEKKSKKDR